MGGSLEGRSLLKTIFIVDATEAAHSRGASTLDLRLMTGPSPRLGKTGQRQTLPQARLRVRGAWGRKLRVMGPDIPARPGPAALAKRILQPIIVVVDLVFGPVLVIVDGAAVLEVLVPKRAAAAKVVAGQGSPIRAAGVIFCPIVLAFEAIFGLLVPVFELLLALFRVALELVLLPVALVPQEPPLVKIGGPAAWVMTRPGREGNAEQSQKDDSAHGQKPLDPHRRSFLCV